jgi:hypothetical protein
MGVMPLALALVKVRRSCWVEVLGAVRMQLGYSSAFGGWVGPLTRAALRRRCRFWKCGWLGGFLGSFFGGVFVLCLEGGRALKGGLALLGLVPEKCWAWWGWPGELFFVGEWPRQY